MSQQWKYFWIAVILITAMLIGYWLYKKNRRAQLIEIMEQTKGFFGKLLWSQELREDTAGSGQFDPVKEGGARPTEKHNGVDLLVKPGDEVYSPMDARVLRKAFPYPGDLNYEGLLLEGIGEYEGYRFKIFYIQPLWTNKQMDAGVTVKKGMPIGIAQAISKRYPGKKMKDHIHVELYAEGKLQDPTKVLLA